MKWLAPKNTRILLCQIHRYEKPVNTQNSDAKRSQNRNRISFLYPTQYNSRYDQIPQVPIDILDYHPMYVAIEKNK